MQPSAIRTTPAFDPTANIGRLLGRGETDAARRALAGLAPERRQGPMIKRWAALVGPPTIRAVSSTDSDRSADYRWLAQNAARHKGSWVALRGGEAIAIAPTLRALKAALEGAAEPPPLVHHC